MRSILTQPNMYARGILFGKMKYELGDHSFVRCPELGLVADIEFKVKGWVSGVYNAIGGVIKNEHTGEVLYELSGMWSEEMCLKNMKVCSLAFSQANPERDANSQKDWTQGCVLQRPKEQTYEAFDTSDGGAGRTRIATVVGKNRTGSEGPKPRARYGREDVG
jgi:hypothetical protein